MPKNVYGNIRRGLIRDESGAAGIEMAMVCFLLVFFLLNGLEFARYSFYRMQAENAAHAAAMSVWKACDTSHSPATTNCTTAMNSAITTGLQSTALGTAVTQKANSLTEGYYCINSTSGALVSVAAATATRPANCAAQGDSTHAPGDYLFVTATVPYAPMFVGVGFANTLPTTIESRAGMRLL